MHVEQNHSKGVLGGSLSHHAAGRGETSQLGTSPGRVRCTWSSPQFYAQPYIKRDWELEFIPRPQLSKAHYR